MLLIKTDLVYSETTLALKAATDGACDVVPGSGFSDIFIMFFLI